MARVLLFGFEILPIVRIVLDGKGNPSAHRDTAVHQSGNLQRVVRDQIHGSDAQAPEHLRRYVIGAKVVRIAQVPVGLIRVHSLGLERIGLDLVGKYDSAHLLAKVENDAALILPEEIQSSVELVAAIAPHAGKSLAAQAFAVYPGGNTLPTGDISHDQ